MTLLALLLGGCPSAAKPVSVPAPVVTKSVPPLPPCVEKAEQALEAMDRLQEHGHLDRAFLAHLPHWNDCPAAHPVLYLARFALLQDLDYHHAARELAAEVQADPNAPKAARQLAARLLAALPKEVADELTHATQMADEGKREAAANNPERAQMLFDRALHANLRATSQEPQVTTLSRHYELQLIGNDQLVVPVKVMPSDAGRAVVVQLTNYGDEVRARPQRLVGHGEGIPTVSAGSDGSFALAFNDKTAWYANPSAEPVDLPAALRVHLGPGGVVVLTQRDSTEIRSAAAPAVVVGVRPAMIGADDRATEMVQLAEGRFVVLCEGIAGAQSVFVVDTKTKAFTVAVDEVLQCRLDETHQRLVVARALPTTSPPKVVVELYPIDGQAPITVPFVQARTIESVYVAPLRDEVAHVSAEVNGKRREMFVRLSDGRVVARPQPTDHGPLRDIPVGSATDFTDVSPLAPLSVPPRKVFEPYFAKLQVWANNGVRSFDRKTVAVFDAGPDGDDVQLIIADTSPLKVRHRIPLSFGINWLTAFFTSDHLLTVQSYPAQIVFDVATGEQIADLDMQDFFDLRTLRPDLIAHGTNVWSTATAKHPIDLQLMNAYQWQSKDGVYRAKLGDGSLTLQTDGKVRFEGTARLKGGEAPNWLHCRFGDHLVDWEICATRLTQR